MSKVQSRMPRTLDLGLWTLDLIARIHGSIFNTSVAERRPALRALVAASTVQAADRRNARHGQLQRTAPAQRHDLPFVHFTKRPAKAQRPLSAAVDRRLKVLKEWAAGVRKWAGAQ